jgi:hypothetical protein
LGGVCIACALAPEICIPAALLGTATQ